MSTKSSQKITRICDSVIVGVYFILLAVVMVFHEPWFDEAQAWLIARDASLAEILFSIPHYEGHPPLWHLILMPLAKLHVPFEWGIKSVNLLFATLAMGLFVFKAPFRRLIRYVIPFTYFFFYQYGVISRPYSLMMLGFVLAALAYAGKDQKPWRFILSLMIICGASAYGIVLAAGITIVWIVEAFRQRGPAWSLRTIIHDKRFPAWLTLLACNILLLLMIYPLPDTYGINIFQNSSRLVRLFYMLLLAPADATCAITYYDSTITLELNGQLAASLIAGLMINGLMIFYTAVHKKLYLFIIPYLLFSLFGGLVYFMIYHIGIVALFYLFIIWVCSADSDRPFHWLAYLQKHAKSSRERLLIKSFLSLIVLLPIAVSLYWNISASIHDVIYPYDPGKAVAAYIKENNLDELNILSQWAVLSNEKTGEAFNDYNLIYGVPTLAYFDTNIYINLNGGHPDKSFLTHRLDKTGVSNSELREQGLPDIVLGIVNLQEIYGEDAFLNDYALIQIIPSRGIWKSMIKQYDYFIFMRRDLLTKYPEIQEISVFVNE